MSGLHPYKIIPEWEKTLQTNAFRVEFIEPQPRCQLRPRDEYAQWVIENRPFHIGLFWQEFGYCIEATSCDECRVNQNISQGVESPDNHEAKENP